MNGGILILLSAIIIVIIGILYLKYNTEKEMSLTGEQVIQFFTEHQHDKSVLKSGIYVTSQARIEIYCGASQGTIEIDGTSRDFEFHGYGDGLYKATVAI